MSTLKFNDSASRSHRWGIVLSGGNGMRLREWVHSRRGDYLPKQYVNFIDQRSMLEHTWRRAEWLIPEQQLITVIAKEHLQFAEAARQVASRAPESIIVQPENKDTAAGILLALMHLDKRDPAAVVTLFPAHHLIVEEDEFMRHIDHGFAVVESDVSRAVLLGTQPDEPDPQYDYILFGAQTDDRDSDGPTNIEMFVEKPSAKVARMMMRKGALWNTLILIITCKSLLRAIKLAAPGLYRAFEPIRDAIGTAAEQRVTERVYQTSPSVDFSKRVLADLPFAQRRGLLVLPVRGVTWCEWATPDRLPSSLPMDAAASEQTARPFPDDQQVAGSYNLGTYNNLPLNRLRAVK